MRRKERMVKILLVGDMDSQREFQRDQDSSPLNAIGVESSVRRGVFFGRMFQLLNVTSMMKFKGTQRAYYQNTVALICLNSASLQDDQYAWVAEAANKFCPDAFIYQCDSNIQENEKAALLIEIYRKHSAVEEIKSQGEWRPRKHSVFPAPQRAAVKELCLLARSKEQSGEEGQTEVSSTGHSPG